MDIESVGIEKDYDTCVINRPEVAKQFINYYDWFLKRFPEEELVRENQKNRIFANIMFLYQICYTRCNSCCLSRTG